MPLDNSILNIMNSSAGAGPWDVERARGMSMDKAGADIMATQASTEMDRMKNETLRERGDVLRNFEGKTDTPEFRKKMMSVDPDLVMKIQENTSKLGKEERSEAKEYFQKIGTMAEMANTPEKWKQYGFQPPFTERERIISGGMTMQQALDFQGDGKKTGGAGGAGGLKAADENAVYKYVAGMFKGVYNPISGQFTGFKDDQSREQAMEISANAVTLMQQDPKLSRLQAARQAAKELGVNVGAGGGSPKPSGSRDYSNLW